MNDNLTELDKIELCKEYYDIYKDVPTKRCIFKDFRIGIFVYGIKQGYNSHIKSTIENIFDTTLKIKPEKVFRPSDIEKVELCRRYYEDAQRIPTFREQYGNFAIGRFVSKVRAKRYIIDPKLRAEMESIFGCISLTNSDENIIRRCKEYYELHHRLPTRDEEFGGLKLGCVIHRIKLGFHKSIKSKIEEIFGMKIESTPRLSLQHKIAAFKGFHDRYSRFPKSHEMYAGVNIGNILVEMRRGKYEDLRHAVEKIYGKSITSERSISR